MTDNGHAIVESLMAEGMGYKKIAKLTGLPLNSVKSYCRRHSAVKPAVEAADGYCRTCGKPVTFVEHRKPKIYCSDACRMKWWNSHKDEVNRKAWYDFTCAHCGRSLKVTAPLLSGSIIRRESACYDAPESSPTAGKDTFFESKASCQ